MSAQYLFRGRKRGRDPELERLVAAELHACNSAPVLRSEVIGSGQSRLQSAAREQDIVDFLFDWMALRPDRMALLQRARERIAELDASAPDRDDRITRKEVEPPQSAATAQSHSSPMAEAGAERDAQEPGPDATP